MRIQIFIILIALFTNSKLQAQKILIPSQDTNFPLYTTLDTSKVKIYSKYLVFGNYDSLKVLEFRKYLKPYAEKNDPLGQYLYAEAHDLFHLGLGTPKDAKIALEFYEKAANQNMAIAEDFLSRAYHYNFMNLETDYKKMLDYLNRAVLHGDKIMKLEGYKRLANIYYRGNIPKIRKNIDKAIEYLEKTLAYKPNDTWTIDFVGSLYADKGDYLKAKEILLTSDNEQSHLKVATWLVEGKVLPRDTKTGTKILREKAKIVQENYENIGEYMGSINPILYLNEAYCQEQITKEEIGEFVLEAYQKYHCVKK